jgi:hypothetical protein
MAFTDTPETMTIVDAAATGDRPSYVDWPAIFGGAVFAAAISFVFLAFGSALGLSLTSAQPGEGSSLWGISIAAGLWLLWVQISGFMAGAYITGRLRRRIHDASEDESDFRDGAHGLMVWAVGVLVGAVLALSTLGAATNTAVNAASTVASGAAAAVGGAVSAAGDNPVVSSYVDRLFRRPAATAEGAAQTVDEALNVTPEERSEVGRILTSSVANGEFAEDDRNYVAGLIARSTGVPQEEARARVDQIVTTAEQAEQTARDAADAARRAALIVAFLTAASLAVSAAAAYYAAGVGGRHRDQGVALDWARYR